MSKRFDIVALGDMLDYGRRVVAKVTGVSRSDFDADDNLQLAITHLLQIVGEQRDKLATQPASNILRSIGRRSWVCEIESFTITCESILMSFG
jgi:hypothetical protein